MKSIKQQYIDLHEGRMSQANFMRNLRMTMPQHITNVTSFNDSVRILKNKGILTEADAKGSSGKEQYSKFTEAENDNLQEITTGVKIEHECFPEKTYKEIVKLVLKNLKKDPYYYSNYKLSGISGAKPETMDKTNTPAATAMKPVKGDNGVDKALGMKPIKGVEKVKKDADAKKETNKGVKGVELMTLIAKTVRGLKKMEGTGEKMKKVIVREGLNKEKNSYQTNVQLKPEEVASIKKVLPDAEFEWDEDDRKQVVYSNKPEAEIRNIVSQALGLGPTIKAAKPGIGDAIQSKLTKESLMQMIREELEEALGIGGGDNVTDVAGGDLEEENTK